MKYGAVVPDVIGERLELRFRDIRSEPVDALRGWSQSLPGYVDGGLRDVQDGDVLVSAREEIIDQRGLTTAYVDDGCGRFGSGPRDQSERGFQVRAIPADGLRRLLAVDGFPMRFCVHSNVHCSRSHVRRVKRR